MAVIGSGKRVDSGALAPCGRMRVRLTSPPFLSISPKNHGLLMAEAGTVAPSKSGEKSNSSPFNVRTSPRKLASN